MYQKLNLSKFKVVFTKYIPDDVENIIESFYVFGSLAKNENLSRYSDIDAILLIKAEHKIHFAKNEVLANFLQDINRETGVKIDPVVVTYDDLPEILSPVIIYNAYHAGVNIYGKNLKTFFKSSLNKCSKKELLRSFLRHLIFRRHLIRKRLLNQNFRNKNNFSPDLIRDLAKEVVLSSRDLLTIKHGTWLRKKQEVVDLYVKLLEANPSLIIQANKIIEDIDLLEGKDYYKFLRQSSEFIEDRVIECIKAYKEITRSKQLNLDSF